MSDTTLDDLTRRVALDRVQVGQARLEALILELLDRLARDCLCDVPLHQRSFGVMEEPPA